jgi:hypothetical protein
VAAARASQGSRQAVEESEEGAVSGFRFGAHEGATDLLLLEVDALHAGEDAVRGREMCEISRRLLYRMVHSRVRSVPHGDECPDHFGCSRKIDTTYGVDC